MFLVVREVEVFPNVHFTESSYHHHSWVVELSLRPYRLRDSYPIAASSGASCANVEHTQDAEFLWQDWGSHHTLLSLENDKTMPPHKHCEETLHSYPQLSGEREHKCYMSLKSQGDVKRHQFTRSRAHQNRDSSSIVLLGVDECCRKSPSVLRSDLGTTKNFPIKLYGCFLPVEKM